MHASWLNITHKATLEGAENVSCLDSGLDCPHSSAVAPIGPPFLPHVGGYRFAVDRVMTSPLKDLLESVLKDPNVVVDKSLLLRRTVFAHQTYQREIPSSIISA